MRSVPNILTAIKQKGKSSADSRKYTPSADQPYSRESFLRRWERDRFASAAPVEAVVESKRRCVRGALRGKRALRKGCVGRDVCIVR